MWAAPTRRMRWICPATRPNPGSGRSRTSSTSRATKARPGVTTLYYHFNKTNPYDVDLQGNPLYNAITPEQEERAREILNIYSHLLGIQFVETESTGNWIKTGQFGASVFMQFGQWGSASPAASRASAGPAACSWTSPRTGSNETYNVSRAGSTSPSTKSRT